MNRILFNHRKKITLITYTPFWLESSGCQQRISGLAELLRQSHFKLELIFIEHQQFLTETDRRILKQQKRFDRIHRVRLAAHPEITRQYFLIKHRLKQKLPGRLTALLQSCKLINSVQASNIAISPAGHFEKMVNGYVRTRVRHLLKKSKPDAVIVEYADLGYVLDGLALDCIKVVDTHDALHLQDQSLDSSKLEKSYAVTQAEERTALERFDVIIAIQNQERELFQKLCPDKTVITLLPWMPVKAVALQPDCENNILFLGYNNKANIHGIRKFLTETWPLLLQSCPCARLLIGGRVSGEIDADQYKNVKCLGFVENLDDFYSLGEITINPVVAGSGLKIKTLEALSRGRICIVTPHSAAGLDTFTGHGLEIAATNKDFASLITKYMTDSNLRKIKMSEALNAARLSVSAENCLRPLLNKLEKNII